ncbi:MAG: hypothetical protein E7259_10020 [Lachnospiraceae bacterium]|nr:hypothetical protein [Lachnospiraceae bacterium]
MRKKYSISDKVMLSFMTIMIMITFFGVNYEMPIASNNSDEEWHFVLSVDSTSQSYIAARDKLDYSKIYFNWGSVTAGNLSAIEVEPYGVRGGKYVPVGTSKGGHKIYAIYNTGKYSITNWALELSCSRASVGLNSYQGSGLAKGVWSPDSVGLYTILQ